MPHVKPRSPADWIEVNPEETAAFLVIISTGHIGEREENVGEFVASPCSPAVAYIKGQTIEVDDGEAYIR